MIEIGGVCIKGIHKDIIFKEINELLQVITVNSEFIYKANKDKRLNLIINKNISTIDGQVPYLISRLKFPKVRIEKISGSDLIYDVAKYSEKHDLKIFLLGGKLEANRESILRLRKEYHIEVDGYSPPFSEYPFTIEHNQKILDKILKFKPHFLFVGFGAGKQEFWIDDHRQYLFQNGVRVAIGCGGTFDFVSGHIKRAPLLMQKLCLEGLYRLIKEPKYFRIKRLVISMKGVLHLLKK